MAAEVAIIGAGLAGITLARRLESRARVRLFEKSYRPGGRLATRERGEFRFDHGAQYFTIRSAAFRAFLSDALAEGKVLHWAPRIVTLEAGKPAVVEKRDEPIYVAQPGMNALCAWLAQGLDITVQAEIVACERVQGAWFLKDAQGGRAGPFDWVISTAPAPQSLSLLGKGFVHADALSRTRMRGCYALMLGFDMPLELGWQGAFAKDSAIGWMALDSSKPRRGPAASLLVQCSGDWADAHIEDDPASVEAALCAELNRLTGLDTAAATHRDLHRWRFAGTAVPAGEDYLLDADSRLAACGDWCIKGRVEAAFRSADALAAALPL